MTGRALRLEDRGVCNPHLIGASMTRQAHQRSSPPHARGHGGPHVRRQRPAATTSAMSRRLTAFLGRSPDTVTADDLRRFQQHQSRGRPAAEAQQPGLGPAFLVHRHAGPRLSSPIIWRACIICASCRASCPRRRSAICWRPRPVPGSNTRRLSASPMAPACAAARW